MDQPRSASIAFGMIRSRLQPAPVTQNSPPQRHGEGPGKGSLVDEVALNHQLISQARPNLPAAARRWGRFYGDRACAECGVVFDEASDRAEDDHILPRSHGGEDAGLNLRPLCRDCNRQRGTRETERSRRWLTLKQRRAAEVERYFQDAQAYIVGNDALRAPQRGGYIELWEHFNERADEPAIVELPTGCGKTTLIAAAPYGIARGRVLIVVPNLTIKETVRRAIAAESPDNVYLVRGILDNPRDLPRYAVIGDGDTPEDVILADIVLANVQQMPAWLPLFESTTFDMVLVDEGHHVPADTWQLILAKFPKAKRVYFTATPYRADGRQIYGREVYRYPLSEAIAQGFVKNVVALDAVPEKLTFTLDGVPQELSLEQVLQLREQDWFSKSIALSEASNRSIVEKCVSALVEQCKTGTRHQIIAAACSIRHAEQVARLFEAAGVRTAIVHSKLAWEEREKRLNAFHAGRVACIVQVGLLGEGYDHPNISIAAVFRPYRSLAAYAQFIGRAMRAIPNAKPGDNVAYVITHKGLNLDRWWQDYKEQRRAAAVLQAIADDEDAEAMEPATSAEDGAEPGDRVLPLEARTKVLDEVISHYDVDSLLGIDAGVRAQAGRRVEPFEVESLRRQIDDLRRRGLPIPDLDDMIETQQAKYASTGGYVMNRTQVERRGLLLELKDRFRRSAAGVLNDLSLDYAGRDLIPLIGKGDERNNYEVTIRLMQRTLNARLELPNHEGRRAWGRDDLRAALRLVGDVRAATLQAVSDAAGRPEVRVAR